MKVQRNLYAGKKMPHSIRRNMLLKILLPVMSMATLSNAQSKDPSPYCASKFSTNYNMLKSLSIKGTTLSFGPMGRYGVFNDYGYYNTFSFPALTKSDTASIIVEPYSVDDIEPLYFAVWIDFNNNGTFDSSEMLLHNGNTTKAALPSFGAPVVPIKKVITIPSSAFEGTVRGRLMRGSVKPFAFTYDSTLRLQACNTATTSGMYGCTYDFNVLIRKSAGLASFAATSRILTVYPNPAGDLLTLRFGTRIPEAVLSVYNSMGLLISTLEVRDQSEMQISTQGLPQGNYFINGYINGEYFSERILIAR